MLVSVANKSCDRSSRYTHNNIGTLQGNVLSWGLCRGYTPGTETEVIQASSEPEASGSQWWPGAMRQSAASKDMNMEAEESMLLWDPLPSNNCRRHGRPRRLSACCSELLSV